METQEQIKEMVRQKYSEIALQDKDTNESSCCGSGCCTTEVYNIMSDDYTNLKGYNPDADLGLGCGLPTQFAQIKKGDVVIDLGSGAGNDAFIAPQADIQDGYVDICVLRPIKAYNLIGMASVGRKLFNKRRIGDDHWR